jgi:hypothetical protein
MLSRSGATYTPSPRSKSRIANCTGERGSSLFRVGKAGGPAPQTPWDFSPWASRQAGSGKPRKLRIGSYLGCRWLLACRSAYGLPRPGSKPFGDPRVAASQTPLPTGNSGEARKALDLKTVIWGTPARCRPLDSRAPSLTRARWRRHMIRCHYGAFMPRAQASVTVGWERDTLRIGTRVPPHRRARSQKGCPGECHEQRRTYRCF